MSNGSIVSIVILTALLTSTGTVVMVEKTGILKPKVQLNTVPDLRGLDEQAATTSLQSARLVLLKGGAVADDKAQPGTVVRQSVAPGSQLEAGQTVQVTLAEAHPVVPSVTDVEVEEARAKLKSVGYEVVVGEPAFDDKVKKGNVLSQKPAANQPLPKGKTVIITVSGGVGEIEVPNLRGKAANHAVSELKDLGLTPKVRWVQWAETSSNVVLKMEPAAGEKLAPEAEVELTVNR